MNRHAILLSLVLALAFAVPCMNAEENPPGQSPLEKESQKKTERRLVE